MEDITQSICRPMKSQSAMEYLMTYGWAILIIAVILGVLFNLGVFNGSSRQPNACQGAPGFLCQGAILGPTGLSFTFGQTAYSRMFDLEMACTGSINSTGNAEAANNVNPYQVIIANGLAITQNVILDPLGSANAPTAIVQSSRLVITGLQCYDQHGILLSSTNPQIGTQFTGFLWVNYSLAINGQNPGYPVTNPIYEKAGTITAQVQ